MENKKLDEEKQELEQLRKFKQMDLCDSVKNSIKCFGEDLGKTEEKIKQLLEIQNKRIAYFRTHFNK